ncbi:MAG TPA: hypothetical protein VFB35_00245 [Gaiellaceae bacterium]|nr:hypothetical protein [Gaiellaceae bacterium]
MTGADFREAVLSRWELSDPELVVLDQAVATLDLINEVEASGMPLKDRAQELRAQRTVLARLISQLNLPDEAGTPMASSTHARARKAAAVRDGRR